MKKIQLYLLLLLLITSSCKGNSSKLPLLKKHEKIDVNSGKNTLCWIDFQIGETNELYIDLAKDSLVKKWGLCYQRIINGCEIDDSTRYFEKIYDIQNQKYFKELEKKFGKDWKRRFNIELQDLEEKLRYLKKVKVTYKDKIFTFSDGTKDETRKIPHIIYAELIPENGK